MLKKDVKTNLLNHSEAKVKLLGKYIEKYLTIICNDGFTKRIRLYDLFCGEGQYDNEGEGSPIVVLRAISEIYKSRKERNLTTPKIDCYFNDLEIEKIEKLKRVIEQKGLNNIDCGELSFSSNDYVNEVEDLQRTLTNLKDEKAFIFIDPYGYKHIRASQINRLMKNRNAEVLLWLPTQHMYRFVEHGTPESLYDFLDEFKELDKEGNQKNIMLFIKQLNNGFQNSIGDDYFVDNFSIKKDENTVFCLYFFTSHIKGFEKMLESKWEIDNEYGSGWEYSGNTPSLFSEYKTNELEIKLKEYLRSEKRFNGDVYEFTLRQRYLPKHTNQIFESWQNNNQLEVYLANGEKARKKSFYIKYHSKIDLNSQIVYFKFK
jgi:three-Cys-motif partner protein